MSQTRVVTWLWEYCKWAGYSFENRYLLLSLVRPLLFPFCCTHAGPLSTKPKLDIPTSKSALFRIWIHLFSMLKILFSLAMTMVPSLFLAIAHSQLFYCAKDLLWGKEVFPKRQHVISHVKKLQAVDRGLVHIHLYIRQIVTRVTDWFILSHYSLGIIWSTSGLLFCCYASCLLSVFWERRCMFIWKPSFFVHMFSD